MIVQKPLNTDNFLLNSKGLFSSWCLYKPHNILFDCGDGCAQYLKYGIFKPNIICFGHSHIDHVAGLLSFIGLRNKTKGDNFKPLTIIYPKGDFWFEKHIKYIFDIIPQEFLRFKINIVAIADGEKHELKKNVYIRAFKTNHTKHSLGYVVCERGKGLKKQYAEIPDIGKKLGSGKIKKEDALEEREARKFAYTLDNCGFNTDEVAGVQEIILDCTFLEEKDRDNKKQTHCTKKECKEMLEKIKPKKYYLAHISPRYS